MTEHDCLTAITSAERHYQESGQVDGATRAVYEPLLQDIAQAIKSAHERMLRVTDDRIRTRLESAFRVCVDQFAGLAIRDELSDSADALVRAQRLVCSAREKLRTHERAEWKRRQNAVPTTASRRPRE